MAFPINETLQHYNSWKGYQEEADVDRAKRKYGLNEYGFIPVICVRVFVCLVVILSIYLSICLHMYLFDIIESF